MILIPQTSPRRVKNWWVVLTVRGLNGWRMGLQQGQGPVRGNWRRELAVRGLCWRFVFERLESGLSEICVWKDGPGWNVTDKHSLGEMGDH